jgi:hypothetical protein
MGVFFLYMAVFFSSIALVVHLVLKARLGMRLKLNSGSSSGHNQACFNFF